ncbi:MAG: hypothetical protein F4Y38_08450 [Gemmatimonadetes bacterium]|nr:hypothetical protein [Gemmatimonadota bacterium]MYG84514.1 hypothetical protein [Gemmatimonadota bacterium]MYJ91358.1 hypothetical protein [Gemmatimonadota bacterium]
MPTNGMISIPLSYSHGPERHPAQWPVTRGVPIPEGMLRGTEGLVVVDPDGDRVPAQIRVLGRWADGSMKWVLVDFQAKSGSSGRASYQLTDDTGDEAPAPRQTTTGNPNTYHSVRVEETENDLHVDTGVLRFRVDRHRYRLYHDVSLGDAQHSEPARAEFGRGRDRAGDAWARISEGASDGELKRRLYGPGGLCRASLAGDSYSVAVEERGPLRTVIRLESALEADIPMHHYGGYRPVRCITRIHAYAGQAFLRILQTHVFTCNPREVEIEDLALDVPTPFTGFSPDYAFGLNGIVTGTLDQDERLRVAQKEDNQVRVMHGRPGLESTIAEDEACEGWATLSDGKSGVGVACRNMAEEFPRAIEMTDEGRLTVYARHDPDGGRLSLARYAEEVAWHEGEGVYADGTGIARTTECYVLYFEEDRREEAVETLQCALSQPHVSVSPEWMDRCGAAGGFAASTLVDAGRQGIPAASNPARESRSESRQERQRRPESDPDRERRPESAQTPRISLEMIQSAERMMTGFADWLARNIRLGRWYGYLDYGDVRATWDEAEDDWKSQGRWGWCNSEWDPRHAVWIQYQRTTDPRYFALAEAMTRHSMDVDTCHWHPFRPYMVGGCYRHGVDHFSDEPCASHTFVDNWVDHYHLTGDGRTLEVLREAGAFFLRYRWTEDSAFSFSLRSIANVLRGLLYVYEATGEERFLRRAEDVYAIVARGQNEDGSWHKRFQVATPDRLPKPLPYGMATEGTTLAVETGTADPFTDDEFRGLGGPFSRMIRDLPYEEQKGYQTHYLMIGLELMHRMTGRKDVAEAYRRAVDWFCGFPDTFASDRPLKEHYGGILCRHLGYAHRLTGDHRYLETGLKILEQLIDVQDWSEDPRKRGSIDMNPSTLSLLFFGVPGLLAALRTRTVS